MSDDRIRLNLHGYRARRRPRVATKSLKAHLRICRAGSGDAADRRVVLYLPARRWSGARAFRSR